jgi:hypothetical protein
MTTLSDARIEHVFPSTWSVTKYDDWPYVRDHVVNAFVGKNKCVDFLALDPAKDTLWLVEAKDFRHHGREKEISAPEELALKIRGTLVGLVAAAKHHAPHKHQSLAQAFLRAAHLRIVFHLEQPTNPSKLLPRVCASAAELQKLKQMVRIIDPHPMVVDSRSKLQPPWAIRAT